MNWNTLASVEQLEQIKESSFTTPILIFKHSTRCSISATALNRLERKWSDKSAIVPYYLDLIAHRDVSTKIQETFGIPHESPQVLLIRDGKCIFDASHFSISVETLEKELS